MDEPRQPTASGWRTCATFALIGVLCIWGLLMLPFLVLEVLITSLVKRRWTWHEITARNERRAYEAVRQGREYQQRRERSHW